MFKLQFPVCDPGHSGTPARSSQREPGPSPKEAAEGRKDQLWCVTLDLPG